MFIVTVLYAILLYCVTRKLNSSLTMHNFKKFPELTNGQMEVLYFQSPHAQILDDFRARCVKVIDGDTIRVKWDLRDFDFPVRLSDIAAPELSAKGGLESQQWLENKLLGREIDIIIDYHNRVDKWGRLLGKVYAGGFNISEESIIMGHAVPWDQLGEGDIIDDISIPKELQNG